MALYPDLPFIQIFGDVYIGGRLPAVANMLVYLAFLELPAIQAD